MTRAGEFEWIARYLSPLAADGSFELKDDAALLAIPDGQRLVVTQDAIAENVHFLPDDPTMQIAQKALRVNISDVISKGAKPFAYSLALGVPDRWEDQDMAEFCKGLEADQKTYGLELTGGDTFRSPDRLVVSITLFGSVSTDGYVSRLNAQPGDVLLVSGTIGDGALGLKVAAGELIVETADAPAHLDAYRLPEPPFALSHLVSKFASASMDISDGLLGDCRKLCQASSVSSHIDRAKVPLSQKVAKQINADPNLWPAVLSGGDDYQCLCTVAAVDVEEMTNAAQQLGIALTHIGEIIPLGETNVSLSNGDVPLSYEQDSFRHF